MKSHLNSCRIYIECQFRSTSNRSGEPRPFMTISRQAGAGGITIGRALAKYLDEHDKVKQDCLWTVFDKNLIAEVLKEHGLSESLESYMPEDKKSELDDAIEELFGLHPAQWTLIRKTSETILRIAKAGRVIIVGRGANILTRQFSEGFHIRLVGSFQKRLEHVKDYYGLNAKQAEEMMKREDLGRKDYLKKYFGRNIDDPLMYDLVLNTDAVTYEDAGHFIGQMVLKRLNTLKASAASKESR